MKLRKRLYPISIALALLLGFGVPVLTPAYGFVSCCQYDPVGPAEDCYPEIGGHSCACSSNGTGQCVEYACVDVHPCGVLNVRSGICCLSGIE